MIRERRDADLDPLCDILSAIGQDGDLRTWLRGDDGARSWVFDQAPVTVAPTRNVVGHLQMYPMVCHRSASEVGACTGRPVGDLVGIGKLFVKPSAHDGGIARYLLKEAVDVVTRQGKLPVLDLETCRFPARELAQRLGFEEILSAARGGRSVMARTK